MFKSIGWKNNSLKNDQFNNALLNMFESTLSNKEIPKHRPISLAGSRSYLSDWGKASLCLSPPCWEVQDWTDWNWCRGSYRDCLLVVANVYVKSAAEPHTIFFGFNYLKSYFLTCKRHQSSKPIVAAVGNGGVWRTVAGVSLPVRFSGKPQATWS